MTDDKWVVAALTGTDGRMSDLPKGGHQFPDPTKWVGGTGRGGGSWYCPSCGQAYFLTKPKKSRWWRNWSAPDGYWRAR